MIAIEFINKILDRLNSENECYFLHDEVITWPTNLLTLFIDAKFLVAAEKQTQILCEGCEQHCLMPIHIMPAHHEKPGRAFILCDKDHDMGRIVVNTNSLKRWSISLYTLACCIAELINLPASAVYQKNATQWYIGIYQGTTTRRPLLLSSTNEIQLLLAGHVIPVIDVLDVADGQLSMNVPKLNKLVATPKGSDETPDERRERFLKRKAQLIAQGERKFIPTLAKEEGVSESAIKQVLYRKKPSSFAKNVLNATW